MKIAVCSQNRKTITGHAGKCRKFWIYEINDQQVVTKTLLELPLEQSFHESIPGAPHPLDGMDVLIGGGMGQGMNRRLAGMGIQAVLTPETDPDQAVSAFLDGSLVRGEAESDDEHHHHHHDHGHQGHGQGRGNGHGTPKG